MRKFLQFFLVLYFILGLYGEVAIAAEMPSNSSITSSSSSSSSSPPINEDKESERPELTIAPFLRELKEDKEVVYPTNLRGLQQTERIWRKSLDIVLKGETFGPLEGSILHLPDFFRNKKVLLDRLLDPSTGLKSLFNVGYAATVENICFGHLTFIVKVDNTIRLFGINLPSIYLSGSIKFDHWTYLGVPVKNVLTTLNIERKPIWWLKERRADKSIAQEELKAIHALTHLNILSSVEHAESCMVLDLANLLNGYMRKLKEKIGKPFTIRGTIFNVLTYMDPCGKGCMPMFFKLPDILTEQLRKNILSDVTIASKLSNTVLIAGVEPFKDTRAKLNKEGKKQIGEIPIDSWIQEYLISISLDNPKSQVFVSTYEDAVGQ